MSGSTSNGNSISYGSDSITLKMAEDQALGVDAQFTVNVDGQQIGGVQTVTASQSSGQTEAFTFYGNYDPGSHDVTVSFVNNFIYPGVSGDRNLYVDGVTYNGQTVSNSTTPIYETALFPPNSTSGDIYGNAVFKVNDTTSIPSGASSNQTTTPGAVSVGSGGDTLVLKMAEDPYQGDAQFTVSVDGKQIGGTQTTTAVVSQGQTQEFDVHGDFGGGTHTVSVNFLNDQIGDFYPSGTPGLPAGQWAVDTTDRNLYVMGLSLNGGPAASGAPWELSSSGSASFSVTAGSNSGSGNSGSNDTTATSDNTAISSESLSAGATSDGSSSGMNFIAPSTTSGTGAGSGDTNGDSSGTSDAVSIGGAADTSASIAAVASGTPQSTQDFSTPSTSSSSGDNTTPASSGNIGHWWNPDHGGHYAGSLQQNS